jgi:hypothetical protein
MACIRGRIPNSLDFVWRKRVKHTGKKSMRGKRGTKKKKKKKKKGNRKTESTQRKMPTRSRKVFSSSDGSHPLSFSDFSFSSFVQFFLNQIKTPPPTCYFPHHSIRRHYVVLGPQLHCSHVAKMGKVDEHPLKTHRKPSEGHQKSTYPSPLGGDPPSDVEKIF